MPLTSKEQCKFSGLHVIKGLLTPTGPRIHQIVSPLIVSKPEHFYCNIANLQQDILCPIYIATYVLSIGIIVFVYINYT